MYQNRLQRRDKLVSSILKTVYHACCMLRAYPFTRQVVQTASLSRHDYDSAYYCPMQHHADCSLHGVLTQCWFSTQIVNVHNFVSKPYVNPCLIYLIHASFGQLRLSSKRYGRELECVTAVCLCSLANCG